MFRTILAITLPAALLAGQARSPRGERPFHREGHPEPRMGAIHDRIAARLYQIRVTRLQQSLGLSEDKAAGIAKRWACFDEEAIDRRREMRQIRQQSNDLLLGPGTEEEKNAKLRPLMDRFGVLRQQQQDARKKLEDDIRNSLSPSQQGRFLLLEEEMQRVVQEAIQDLKKDH